MMTGIQMRLVRIAGLGQHLIKLPRTDFESDGVFPLFAAVSHVGIETCPAEGNRDDELSDFAVADHAIEDLIRISTAAPTRFVLEQTMEEVEHRIFPVGRL